MRAGELRFFKNSFHLFGRSAMVRPPFCQAASQTALNSTSHLLQKRTFDTGVN